MLHRAADHLRVVDHFVERHGQRAIVPLHDHRHAVAHQNAFHAGRIHQPGQRIVVRGDHRDLAAGGFETGEFGNGDAGHVRKAWQAGSREHGAGSNKRSTTAL